MPTTQDWMTLSEAAQQLQLPARFLEKLATKKDSDFGGPVLPMHEVDGNLRISRKVLEMLQDDIFDHHHWAVQEAVTTKSSLEAGCTVHTVDQQCGVREMSRDELYDQELYLLDDPHIKEWYPHLFPK